ncbi:MAG: AAA family ATPase, partial [Pseudomonadales bacterium]|nr:AAA family ATPase [Pseudomonadales bacterium]
MRLLDLRLDKFGPFTDYALDLKGNGVHVIYGPNEAGKSSTLRAITNFLYGFPSRTSDDHLHQQRSLRVGAKVQQGDGTGSADKALILYRKKGNKGTLLDESDQIVDDLTLAKLLHNLPKDQFVTFFGIDSKTLVAGGEDLIKGQGNLGEALFSASMGGQQFQQLLKELDARQNELFKNTGSNPKLNVAIKELKQAVANHKEHCLKSTDWEKADRLVNEATKALNSITSQHKAVYSDKERLDRIKRTLPNLSSRTDIVTKLKEIEEVPTLPHDSSETRLKANAEIKRCQSAIEQLNADIQNCENQLTAITINETVLAQDVAIDALKHGKALYKKNSDEFQLLQGEVTEKENELEALAANLLPAHSSKRPEELILTTVIRAGLGSLVEEGVGIETTLTNIKTKQQDNDLQLAEAEEMLVELPESVAIGDLQLTIKDAERLLITEQEIHQLRQQIRDLEEATTNTACQLGLTLLDENKLLTLPIPSTEKITALKTKNEKLIEEKRRELKALADLDAEISELEIQQKEANVSGQLVTENDLTTARQERDTLWLEIKNDWTGQAPPVTDQHAKANIYETSTGTADQYADRLRREADQLAEYGLKEIQLEKLQDDRSEQRTTLNNIDGDIQSSSNAWKALWPAEVESLGSYDEMTHWESSFRQLQTSLTEKTKLNAEIEDKSPRIANCIRTLASVVKQSGVPTDPNKSLAFLVDQANSVLARLIQTKEDRQSHETRKKDALKQQTKLSHELNEANQAKDHWLQRWNNQIVVLEIPKESSIATAKIQLDQFDRLAELLKNYREIKGKRNTLNYQITQFEDTVTKLTAECELMDGNPSEPLIKLHKLAEALNTALENKNKVQTIRANKQRHQSTLKTETQTMKEAQEGLDSLYKLADCETIEQLQLIETQNSERVDLKKSLTNLDKMLEAESFTIDKLYAEIEGINVDELPLMIDQTAKVLEMLEQNKQQAIEDKTKATSEFYAL